MGNLAPGRPVYNAALNVSYIDIAFNIFASFLTLVLIWYMRHNGSLKVNLYLKCVLLMTFHQLVYDVALTLNYPCGPSTGNYACVSVFAGGFTFGGIGAAVWALMIIVATTFMIEFGRQPTEKERNITLVLTQLFIIAWGVIYAIGGYNAHKQPAQWSQLLVTYNHFRLAIIGITGVVLLRLVYKMWQVTHGTDRASNPLYHLTRRLIWYPIIQVVCRLGATPYNLTYQSTIDSYPEGAGGMQTFLLFFAILLAPLAGGGAFLVFLTMQSGAWKNLKLLLCCRSPGVSEPAQHGRWNVDGGSSPAGNKSRLSNVSGQSGFTLDPIPAALGPPGLGSVSATSQQSGCLDQDRASDWTRLSVMDEEDLVQDYFRDLKISGEVTEGAAAGRISTASRGSSAGQVGGTRAATDSTNSKGIGESGRSPLHGDQL